MTEADASTMPQHVVIIPDGNRRWAKNHGLRSIEGHKKGLETALTVARASRNLGIKFLTLWGFSTDNWQRSKLEVTYLMRIYATFFKKHVKELLREGVRFKWIGRRDRVPAALRRVLENIEKETAKNTRYFLNICIDYGGHDEIISAFKKIIAKKIKASQINEDLVASHLETAGIPNPDLLIRTSGEKRTSGIMPWQTAYTELYFSKVHFPDFSVSELKRALADYSHRQRRYGQ